VKGGTTLAADARAYTPPGPAHGSARPITLRGSPITFGTNGTASNVVTLATPNDLFVGDLEVAQISTAASAGISSVPAGWSLIREDLTGSTGNDLRQTLYYHVAQASEPVINSWGLTQAVSANGALSAW